ncbi:MAG: uroporphyrinogen decarboxylase family protein [Actinomycetota bacterium]|nr:uroporphyrinogen decarboxylase family protein [Actinomycetota bacterium]
MIDTLLGSQSGVSRELWEEMEGPYSRCIAEEVRSCGVMMALHNCGNGPYFDLQIEYMEPVILSFADLPDDCSSPREMKEKYGHLTALAGYIPTDDIMLKSPPRG